MAHLGAFFYQIQRQKLPVARNSQRYTQARHTWQKHFVLPRNFLSDLVTLIAIGQKKASSPSSVFTRDTRNMCKEKSSGQTHCTCSTQSAVQGMQVQVPARAEDATYMAQQPNWSSYAGPPRHEDTKTKKNWTPGQSQVNLSLLRGISLKISSRL